jgi:pyridoxine 4-dehydrogenase
LTTANLELLARFFDRYPGYADRTFISVKGGALPGVLVPDGSRKNLRRSVDAILGALRGTKRLDLFEPGRLDPNYTVEQQAGYLNEMVREGKFDYIGLSVVSADTIRRAHKVRKRSLPLSVLRTPLRILPSLGHARRCGRNRSEP